MGISSYQAQLYLWYFLWSTCYKMVLNLWKASRKLKVLLQKFDKPDLLEHSTTITRGDKTWQIKTHFMTEQIRNASWSKLLAEKKELQKIKYMNPLSILIKHKILLQQHTCCSLFMISQERISYFFNLLHVISSLWYLQEIC